MLANGHALNTNDILLYEQKDNDKIISTQLFKFQKLIQEKYNLHFKNYHELYKWSIDNHVTFWREFWHFSNLLHSKSYDLVLNTQIAFEDVPEWFHGSRLNYAENLLKWKDVSSEKVAVYSFGESFKEIKSITFAQLTQRVSLYQQAMKLNGINKGDRIVGYLPNCIESLEACLSTFSLGAIWSCTSPDFGSLAVIDRFHQIQPKILFSVTCVAYNGKIHDHRQKLKEVIAALPSIEKVVLVPFVNESQEDLNDIPKSISLSDFLLKSSKEMSIEFEQVPFNHPLTILYSSGTTGKPKCIVHSHGGTLIQHLKEHMLHGNVKNSDVIFYYTTAGWMMYNWLISSLSLGASIVLYDGSPLIPTPLILWDLVDKLNITMFGTSAKFLSLMEDKQLNLMKSHKFASLNIIYSTGSPLRPSCFDYVYSMIKKDLLLCSITGGTDIISLFAGHNVTLNVYRGEIQCRQLGMAVESWTIHDTNDTHREVYDECGELVCTRPFPSMPIYFWNDANNETYKSSYFRKFKCVWSHGDYCVINSVTGGVTMLGRSDGTLNPNGVRFGSAEIYNIVEKFEEIDDSLCIGQRNPKLIDEERVVLFLKINENFKFNDKLVNKVRSEIRVRLSARHVPAVILPIDEIPYTLNGKKVEVPIRRLIEGNKNVYCSSLVNPNVLELYKNIEALSIWQ